ncbi:hypothetical protein LCGC14_0657610, partial [marine sediment metagenome]
MPNKKSRNKTNPPNPTAAESNVKPEDNITRLVKNKDGLLVPDDQVKEDCKHTEPAKR